MINLPSAYSTTVGYWVSVTHGGSNPPTWSILTTATGGAGEPLGLGPADPDGWADGDGWADDDGSADADGWADGDDVGAADAVGVGEGVGLTPVHAARATAAARGDRRQTARACRLDVQGGRRFPFGASPSPRLYASAQ